MEYTTVAVWNHLPQYAGGAVLFSGEVRGTFRHGTFKSTCLHVAHGAYVAVSDFKWRSSHAAVVAHGNAMRADVLHCTILARFGAIVEMGAAVTVRPTALRCSVTAFAVTDAGSRVTVEFCFINGRQAV